jgi:hypothetical protein
VRLNKPPAFPYIFFFFLFSQFLLLLLTHEKLAPIKAAVRV